MTAVVEAPRRVSSEARSTRPECAAVALAGTGTDRGGVLVLAVDGTSRHTLAPREGSIRAILWVVIPSAVFRRSGAWFYPGRSRFPEGYTLNPGVNPGFRWYTSGSRSGTRDLKLFTKTVSRNLGHGGPISASRPGALGGAAEVLLQPERSHAERLDRGEHRHTLSRRLGLLQREDLAGHARSEHMDETTTATAGRAASGSGRVKKKGGQKSRPRKTSTPTKKPKQVRLPFDGGK